MTARRVNPWAALSALCLGFFMIMLDMSILNIAVPVLLRDLGASLNQVVWVTSAYVLAWAVPMLLSGRLGDRYGRRRVFLAGLVVFTVASACCGLSATPELLIAARALQGIGAALITPQTLAFVTHLFPPQRRGAALGTWGAVAGLATIAGPLAGGVLVETVGWQGIFFVNVPVGLIGIVLTLLLVPAWRPGTRHRLDLPGVALSGIGLFCVIFGVQNGERYHWGTIAGPVTVTEVLVLGGVALAAFVGWQHHNRRGEPLVPLDLFRSRNFALGNLATVLIGICMTGAFLPLALLLQNVLGLSPLDAGLMLAPSSVVSGVLAPFAGRLCDRIGGRWVATAGFAMTAVGLGVTALVIGPDIPPLRLVPGLVVMGAGIGCVFSPLSSLALQAAPPQRVGAASGVFNTFRQVGSVLGSALLGVLLQARLAATMPAAAVRASAGLPAPYRSAFVADAGAAGAGGAPVRLPGIPADLTATAGRLAATAFRDGFAAAAGGTLILPVAALVLGVLVCLLFRGGTGAAPTQAAPAAAERESAVAA